MSETAIALRPVTATVEQMAILRQTICRDATDAELQFFLQFCAAKGLDPFAKEVYFTKRQGKDGKPPSITIQTGIDGLRGQAESSGEYEGQEGPFWCGADGKWTDVWTKAERPFAAKVGVFKRGFRTALYAIARWQEYYPSNSSEQWMWNKMPSNQLAKCAEALALRKAFPRKLGGIYAKEELDQANEGTGRVTQADVEAHFKKLEDKATATVVAAAMTVEVEPPGKAPAPDGTPTSFSGKLPSASSAPPSDSHVASSTDDVECWVWRWTVAPKKSNGKKGEGEWRSRGSFPRRTQDQNAQLQAKRKELGLSDDDWRSGLRTYYRKDTSRDLSVDEADDLIERLQKRWNMRKYKHPDDKAAAQEQRATEVVAEIGEYIGPERVPGAEG